MRGDIDVLGLSETWLKQEIPNTMLKVNNYHLIRQDRRHRNIQGHIKSGGGICMYIKSDVSYDDIIFKHLNVSDINLEMQLLVINGKNSKKIIIANCYRPPSGNIDIGVNLLKIQLGRIPNIDRYEIVIMGDINHYYGLFR